MIQYSIDTDIRTKVIFGIAVAAAALSGFLKVHLPDWMLAPATISLFGLLYLLYDTVVWRLNWLQKLHGLTDLSGQWHGSLDRTNIATGATEQDVSITINISQTWSKMEINLVNDTPSALGLPTQTRSTVSAAHFKTAAAHSKLLRYIFSFDLGYGVAELQLSEECDKLVLKGNYVSSQMNHGHIYIERKK